MATAAKPHLLGLPGELRNHIYRYVLLDETMEVDRKNIRQRTGLLQTCRQLRKEAIGIFFAENHFRVHFTIESYPCLIQWLENLGPHAERIIHLGVIPKWVREFQTTLKTVFESYGTAPIREARWKIRLAVQYEWFNLLHKWQSVLIEQAKSLVVAGVSVKAIPKFAPAALNSRAMIIQQAFIWYVKSQMENEIRWRGQYQGFRLARLRGCYAQNIWLDVYVSTTQHQKMTGIEQRRAAHFCHSPDAVFS